MGVGGRTTPLECLVKRTAITQRTAHVGALQWAQQCLPNNKKRQTPSVVAQVAANPTPQVGKMMQGSTRSSIFATKRILRHARGRVIPASAKILKKTVLTKVDQR